LGETTISTEPDLILSKSPSDSAGMLNKPLPSPVIVPSTFSDLDTNKEPVILVSVLTTKPLSGEI